MEKLRSLECANVVVPESVESLARGLDCVTRGGSEPRSGAGSVGWGLSLTSVNPAHSSSETHPLFPFLAFLICSASMENVYIILFICKIHLLIKKNWKDYLVIIYNLTKNDGL